MVFQHDLFHRMSRQWPPLVIAALSSACAMNGPTLNQRVGGDDQIAHAIVTFKAATPMPADTSSRKDFLDRLATATDVDWIEIVAPAAGDRWSLDVSCNDTQGRQTSDPCAAAVERLARTAQVARVDTAAGGRP